MASTFADKSGGAPSKGCQTRGDNQFQKPLAATLKTSREELQILRDQRDSLCNKIRSSVGRLNEPEQKYWASDSKAVQQYCASHGNSERHFDQWRVKYAKERSLDVQKRMEEQRAIREQMRKYEEDLDKVNVRIWDKIQSINDNVAAAPLEFPKTPHEVTAKQPSRQMQRQTRAARAARRSSAATAAAADASRSARGPRYHRSPASPATSIDLVPRQRKKKQPVKPVTRPDPSSFQGVANAVPRRFYQAYYPSSGNDEGWYMGYTLPWDGDQWSEDIALQFSMRQIDLKTDWPKCYIPETTEVRKEDEDGNIVTDTIITGIKGWAPGFEDGGPHVKERVFLFLYLDDAQRSSAKLRVPKKAGMKIKFTKAEIASGNVPIDWAPAAYLRPVGADVGSIVKGRQTARKFEQMLRDMDTMNRQDLDSSAQYSQIGSDDVDNGRGSWDEDEKACLIPHQRDSHRDVNLGSENGAANMAGREIHVDQDSQADVSLQPRLSHDTALGEHDEEDLAKTPVISPSLRRLSSIRGDDSHSDEGVIMDYDLEVENSASQKRIGKEAAFDYRQFQRRGEMPSNEGSDVNLRGASNPPNNFLSNSLLGEPRAQSLPSARTTETTE